MPNDVIFLLAGAAFAAAVGAFGWRQSRYGGSPPSNLDEVIQWGQLGSIGFSCLYATMFLSMAGIVAGVAGQVEISLRLGMSVMIAVMAAGVASLGQAHMRLLMHAAKERDGREGSKPGALRLLVPAAFAAQPLSAIVALYALAG